MKAHSIPVKDTGKIIYDAITEQVRHLPVSPAQPLSPEDIQMKMEQAKKSQKRHYPGDWVWKFVEGDGVHFDYSYDFIECGTQKLYHEKGADEFLPFYCYLDFVLERTTGWGFTRTMTLAEGHDKCDFRWKKGGETQKGWPPPFLEEELN